MKNFLPGARQPIVLLALLTCLYFMAGCSFFGSSQKDRTSSYKTVATFFETGGEAREPFGIAFRNGEIYVSDGEAGSITRLDQHGTASILATGLNTPSAIAFRPNGDLIVADTGSHTIKRVTSDGAVEIFSGVENVSGSSDGPALTATFNGPIGLAIDDRGDIYVSDTYNDRIRLIRDGQVSTLSGGVRGFADGTSSNARFDTPLGLTIWQDKLLVADSLNRRIRVVEPSGEVWTLAGNGDETLRDGTPGQAGFVMPTAITVNSIGHVIIADGNAIRVIGHRVFPFVETISDDRRGYVDGSALRARFNRPSGLAVGGDGEVYVADSSNGVIRVMSDGNVGREASTEEIDSRRIKAEVFRKLESPRWPYDPPLNPREVAGTLGEIRGEISAAGRPVWFHNGFDIAGGYGEVAKFVRTESVLDPHSAQNFGTSRELLRLPTIGYIHIRLGRDSSDRSFADPRFQFDTDLTGKLTDLRVPRGARFAAGDTLGTLNSMNHVHLIAGRSGSEMNALDALAWPGIGDSIVPVIERVELLNEDWSQAKVGDERIQFANRLRIVVEAYDRMDGNSERRKLGLYRLGYQILASGTPLSDVDWTIVFDRMPSNEAVRFAYAPGSRSGATGETRFRYVVSNRVGGESFSEGFLDPAALGPGIYTLRVHAADYFGNTTVKDVEFDISRSER